MGRNNDRPPNRVITISSLTLSELDKWTSELLDIIDAYGGTNPYPRFLVNGQGQGESYFYSCTTKIPRLNIEDFDKEIAEWHNKP